MLPLVPFIEDITVSVPVIVSVPAVVNVALKILVPAVNVVSTGSVPLELLVKCTVPPYVVTVLP
jgi:hypothetical protein